MRILLPNGSRVRALQKMIERICKREFEELLFIIFSCGVVNKCEFIRVVQGPNKRN